MPALTIGKLAKAAQVKVPTIRFYEQIGLLPPAERSESDRRLYDDASVRRLSFIRHARQLGFSVEAIRVLLALTDEPDRPCEEANALAAEQLADVEAKIVRLQALRGELQRMATTNCHGRAGDCRVIEMLSDHALCAHEHERPITLADV
ncbi:MAG: transcriptional regulator [Phenylobacterium zucineum]|nr:MAG: transcriptional regulator [Phenylobacterium zucineum]